MKIRKMSMRYRNIVLLAGLVLGLLTVGRPAAAQIVHGTIVGSVSDTTGAMVPGATVTLTDTDRGVVRITTTSPTGDYQFLDAQPDHYKVDVQAHGFKEWSATGLQLSTLQSLRVDVKLTIGHASETVHVSGENTGVIDTESANITTTFNSQDLLDLPTNFRASSSGTSVLGAEAAMPGVQADQGEYAVQGNLPFETDITVDGITTNQIDGGIGTSLIQPSADDVSSFRLTGVLANAEFGDPAQVAITSIAGTATYHGAAWEYHQNSGMDANTFGAAVRPHVVANTFGGKLGGPVAIPRLYDGRSRKSFFFVDYEGFRLPESVAEEATVPTTAMAGGDFTNYSNPAATYNGLTDPYTGASWGNTIPASVISPVAQQFLKFFPAPNTVATLTGGATVPTTSYVNGESPNYYSNVSTPLSSNQVDVRGDQYFGSNQKVLLWGRYSQLDFPSIDAFSTPFDNETYVNGTKNLAASLSWTIKPNLLNVFLFGFDRWNNSSSDPFNGTAFTQGLGLQGLNDLWYNGLPYISFTNITSPPAGGFNYPQHENTTTYNESLSFTKGRNDFKFGGDVRTYVYITGTGITTGDNYGNFYFSNAGNAVGAFTGVDFADFLLGIPDSSFYDDITTDDDAVGAEYHVYAQDHWRVAPRLSMDLGVRYEYRPGYYDKHGFFSNVDYTVPLSAKLIYPAIPQPWQQSSITLENANACDPDGVNNTNSATVNGAPCMPVVSNTEAGVPRSLHYVDKNRVLPRVGFAYRLTKDSKWVVRAGFGLYNISVLGQTFHSMTGDGTQGTEYGYTNAMNPSTGEPLFAWPEIGESSGGAGCTTCYGTNEVNASIDLHFHDPETSQWALTLEHDFGRGYGLRASYTGSETSHLELKQDQNTMPLSSTASAYNQPLSARRFPNWGILMNYASQATSSYNALAVEGTHRMQNGLQFDSAFTWASALADDQGANTTSFAWERGGGVFSSWVFDKRLDFGKMAGPRRLHWLTTAIYDLPVGRGKQFGADMPQALDAVLGGWQLSNVFTWQTGSYLTPSFPGGEADPSGTGSGLDASLAGWIPTGAAQHPDLVPGVSWKPAHQNRSNWINPAHFACPGWSGWQPGETCATGAGYNANGTPVSTYGPALPIGRFGDSGVGTMEGPGLIQLNSGLAKVISLHERFRLRVEATFTNVTNHTNLDETHLNLNLSSASFGVITAGLPGRTAQIGARMDF
jgi:hypothetical protein